MESSEESKSWAPMQLRIGFSAPSAPCALLLELEGLSVSVETGNLDLATSYLSSVGLTVEVDSIRGLRFPVRDIALIVELPDQVSIRAIGGLSAILEAVLYPPVNGGTVAVTMDGPRTMNLSWYDGTRRYDEPLPLECAPALIASAIPFVAASDTWDAVLTASRLPIIVGRAKVNLDGFVEILAPTPQRIEASPLSGLFRVDATHYGVALAYSDQISSSQGFIWDGPKPVGEQSPTILIEPTLKLSQHVREDLQKFVDGLTNERGRVVVWESGLGRRVFCLAGVASINAFPLLIICAPYAIWAWQRSVALFDRTISMEDDRHEVRIMTYEELERNPRVQSPTAIIFDDLDRSLDNNPSILDQIRRFDGLIDGVRISCSMDFPSDPESQVRILSVVRPGEFRPDVPIALRYPGDSVKRLNQHIEPYIMRRLLLGREEVFTRSSVEVIDTPQGLNDVFTEIKLAQKSVEERVLQLLAATSSGSDLIISPKISKAIEIARLSCMEGLSVAVVTFNQKTVRLLKGMLRPNLVVDFYPEKQISPGITLVNDSSANLRTFDEVIFIDYPWSASILEGMVGEADSLNGPKRVTQIHLAGSIDDRLAVVAGKRSVRSGNLSAVTLPTQVELRWLLAY
jgi:hypothetical protein